MNLFNGFYNKIISEATSKVPKKSSLSELQPGYARQSLESDEALDASVVKLKPSEFSLLKKSIQQDNNDDYEKALDMFNIIKGVSDKAISKIQKTKPELYRALLSTTSTKFHDPSLLKTQNIQQFKANILSELNDSKNKGEIDQKQFVKFFMNSAKWHKLYSSIYLELEKVSIEGDSEQERENIARSKIETVKPLSRRDKSEFISGLKEKAKDKATVFYFDSLGRPYKTSIIIPNATYGSLEENEDNVPVDGSFYRGGLTNFGKQNPPPYFEDEDGAEVNSYDPEELRGKTVSEIKQLVNHGAAKKAYAQMINDPDFRKKYPENKYRKSYSLE